ncbi:hypothetical protein GJ496_006723 [Pomphorhynchus laevis]|nr:hypothetical protein GJ496_006723 [Pomphorhynchus laevis]
MKLLGYKSHNYYDDSDDDSNLQFDSGTYDETCNTVDCFRKYPTAINTGPKGVIEDKRQYQSMLFTESERIQKETLESIKKISLTCELAVNSNASDKDRDEDNYDNYKTDDGTLFKRYCQQRLDEMHRKYSNMPSFGVVTKLSVDNFTASIDREQLDVVITVLVYSIEINADALKCLNLCLDILAKRYIKVKFCTLDVTNGIVSRRFRQKGCPAIIAYQNGVVIGNLVSLFSILGDDIYVDDLETLLLKNNILHAKYINHIV